MSSKNVLHIAIVFILIQTVIFSVLADQSYDADDDEFGELGISTGEPSGDDTDDDEFILVDPTDFDLDEEDVTTYGSQYLKMILRVYCYLPERDGAADTGMVYPKLVVNDRFAEYGYRELDTAELPAITTSTPVTAAYPHVAVSWFDLTDPHNFRFEGKAVADDETHPFNTYGCLPVLGSYHILNVLSAAAPPALGFYTDITIARTFAKIETLEQKEDGAMKPAPGTIPLSILSGEDDPNGPYGRNIVWDESKSNCEIIGGNWLESTETGAYNYEDMRCCGDDAIWRNNQQFNYEDNIVNGLVTDAADSENIYQFCLYGKRITEESQEPAYVNVLESAGQYTRKYLCSPTDEPAYDLKLALDNAYEGETPEQPTRLKPYLFKGTEETETDLGKWSDNAGKNPYYCSYRLDEQHGDTYQWLPLTPASNFNEEQCAELGGQWTGSACCGVMYHYAAEQYIDDSYHDPTPADQLTANSACIRAEAVSSGTKKEVTGMLDATKTYELLSLNGNVYGCNIETSADLGDDARTTQLLIEGQTAKAPCAVVKANNNAFAFVCDPLTNKFYRTNDLYATETMGAPTSGQDIAALPEELPASTPPWDASASTACCFNNGCWDGEACVSEFTSHISTDAAGEHHYTCYQGTWGAELGEDFDWYHNTDLDDNARAFCVQPSSCSCSTNPDDETFCGTVGTFVQANGCTLQNNFFKDDHLCESYTNAAAVATSRWTSRTKILAMQLTQIAGTSQHTLFCDTADKALHDPTSAEGMDANSFCVLRYFAPDEKIIVGTTFNSGDDDAPMEIDLEDHLFGPNGFVTAIASNIEEDDCTAALNAVATAPFGEFNSCSGNTLWLNPILGAVFYAPESLTSVPPLNIPAGNDLLYDYFDELADFIDAYEDEIEEHIPGPSIFANLRDFDRIYLQQTTLPIVFTFGVEEEKYDGEISHANRHYTAVLYGGKTLNCDQVYQAFAINAPEAQVYCATEGQNSVLLVKTIHGSAYWNDLTAKLRY